MKRADDAVKRTLEQVLALHFDGRPFGHLNMLSSQRASVPCGSVVVNRHKALDDIIEFRAEIRLTAPLDQERRLMDRMLETIDFLHEADIPQADDHRNIDDPIIIGTTFETAIFEQREDEERASASLIFTIRTITD